MSYSDLYGVTKILKNYYKHLIKYLSHLNYKSIQYRVENNIFYLYYGNSSLSIENGKYNLHSIGDDIFPNDLTKVNFKKEKDSFDRQYIPIINKFYSDTVGFLDLFIETDKSAI